MFLCRRLSGAKVAGEKHADLLDKKTLVHEVLLPAFVSDLECPILLSHLSNLSFSTSQTLSIPPLNHTPLDPFETWPQCCADV